MVKSIVNIFGQVTLHQTSLYVVRSPIESRKRRTERLSNLRIIPKANRASLRAAGPVGAQLLQLKQTPPRARLPAEPSIGMPGASHDADAEQQRDASPIDGGIVVSPSVRVCAQYGREQSTVIETQFDGDTAVA